MGSKLRYTEKTGGAKGVLLGATTESSDTKSERLEEGELTKLEKREHRQ